MNPSEIVNEIFGVFREHGHRAYGENVTELQHALQCATLAHAAGEPPEIVAACLLHDFGHLLHTLGEDVAERGVDARHEVVGANRLSAWFSADVVEPIRMHAASKRYLCWSEPEYLAGLSEASRRSLALQGGVMSAKEAASSKQGPTSTALFPSAVMTTKENVPTCRRLTWRSFVRCWNLSLANLKPQPRLLIPS